MALVPGTKLPWLGLTTTNIITNVYSYVFSDARSECMWEGGPIPRPSSPYWLTKAKQLTT